MEIREKLEELLKLNPNAGKDELEEVAKLIKQKYEELKKRKNEFRKDVDLFEHLGRLENIVQFMNYYSPEGAKVAAEIIMVLEKSLSAVKDVSYSLSQIESLRRAFYESKFIDPHNVKELFIEYLNDLIYNYDPEKHYAPYTSLIQSSGTGKTRLTKEVSSHFNIVYICLR